MVASTPQIWNERYLAGEFQNREPDPFLRMAHRDYLTPLLKHRPELNAVEGLDLAGGAGRHSMWLAQQGWRMTLSDWSDVALDIARAQIASSAAELAVAILSGAADEVVADLRRQGRRFGFITISFFLDRALLPHLPKILLPGGLLLYRSYTEDNTRLGNPRGPRNPDFLLCRQELLDIYRNLRILHYNETVSAKGVAELIAQQTAI